MRQNIESFIGESPDTIACAISDKDREVAVFNQIIREGLQDILYAFILFLIAVVI